GQGHEPPLSQAHRRERLGGVMGAAPPPPARSRCLSCGGTLAPGRHTCPSCGAVAPFEAALEDMRASLAARAAGLLARLRKRPLHWATWLLAAIPFFVAPPLLAIALAVAARRRQGIDPVMLTVAVANIVLSLYFW